MTDYISRAELDAAFCKASAPAFDNHGKATFIVDYVKVLETIPAADVRPVVLCRDCKYSYDSVGGWCCSHGICVDCIVHENFFCADGVKREES